MKQRKLSVTVPKKRIVRTKKRSDRVWTIDFRGIRAYPPSDFEKKYIHSYRNYRGEKPAFSSPEVLKESVDEYFESCFKPVITRDRRLLRDDKGELIKVQTKPFTVAGLAYHIGVETTTLLRYSRGQMDDLGEENEDLLYSTILSRAKQRIEQFNEEKLYEKDTFNGARFVLDHHYAKTTKKEQAEIYEKMESIKLKNKELELKLAQLDSGSEDEDNEITINIVRKEDEND